MLDIESRKRNVVGTLFLLFLACAAPLCGEEGEDVEVVREINACWDSSDTKVLIVESHYLTPDPEEPYFNATKGHDWRIVLYEAEPDLSGREEIARWDEEAEPGGGLEYTLLYWLREEARLVGMEYNVPYLTNLDTGERTVLIPPEGVLSDLFGDLAPAAAPHNAIPSPDGRTVGVLMSVAYLPDPDNIFDLRFLHAMSFFGSERGEHLGSVLLPFADDRVDPHLTPAEPVVKDRYYFLWRPDSSGVYLLYRQEAFLVSRDDFSAVPVDTVPERAYPTEGGAVSDAGVLLVTEIDGNEATIVTQQVDGWIPFSQIASIPQGTEDYTIDMSSVAAE